MFESEPRQMSRLANELFKGEQLLTVLVLIERKSLRVRSRIRKA